ncbi:alpha/beta fold hydrolase [Sphingomonas sp. NSE70-1]|uniref:Alpha/beta fold hydrolase n=1 Tax=Sphingomonas caseinilyticus TaxID=2908205 RepID=A0ABT0RTD6_9SPHN|nr:alpha/beta fold hydrolase [Sphingomonas caseinilyticus]MCL6698116.1 alpha/beta fold hydrolase [Sphingomonas caseinilyticus]
MSIALRSLLLASLLASTATFAQSPVPTRQVGTATLENVPEIPAEVKESVQRYQNYREAIFRDWLPDGSMLITTRFGATNQIHRVAAPGADRTQITFFDEPIADAETIPGTDRILFQRDTGGDEWFQLYTMGLAGQAVQLTEPGTRNQAYAFSKDGKLLAWSRAIKGSGDYAILTADPANPASRRVAYQGTGAIGVADVSSDKGKALLERGISNRETRLSVLDLASGQATELPWSSDKPARYESARFARNGAGIVAITDLGSDVRRLVDIDVATGKRNPISPADLKWDVEVYDIADNGTTYAYVVNEDGYSRIWLYDQASGRRSPITGLPDGVLTGLNFSPDGGKLAISLSTAKSAGDVWVADLANNGTITRWTSSELGPIDPASLSEPQLIRFKSFDGLSVPAFVYRPAGLPADAKTPVVIDIHGGPESQTRPRWNPISQQMANAIGATVILTNVRGSDGYGTRYLNLDNGPKREDSVKDIGALLDWIATQPNLDKEKVAVYGQSYGGYMSLAVMTHYSDRLVGGVERYGISDFITFLNNTEAYRRDNRRAEYGDEREPAMREVFKRINPLANVTKIKKPMLVMQGANDPRVPKSESDQVVAGIRGNGVEAWYVVYSDEGHGFLKKHNNDLRREVETVFLRKLFGS